VFLHDFTKLFFSYKESKKKEFKTVKPYKFIEKNSLKVSQINQISGLLSFLPVNGQ